VLLCLAGRVSPQGEPGRFAVSQVTYQPPVLLAYVDVLDQSGRPPDTLSPADFSAKIDRHDLNVAAVTPFDKSGEGIAYAFLVDISKSIQKAQFEQMRTAMGQWINGLAPSDKMAIFTFGEQDRQLIDFTADKASLIAALQNIAPTDKQTKLYLALRNAIDLWQRTDEGLPSRRVIVILSDGKDEGSGFTADDVGRLIQESPMPVYAIGFSALRPAERNTYLEALNRIASLSGGLYIAGSSLPKSYTELREAIRRVFIVRLGCEGCTVVTQSQPLEMTVKEGAAVRTDRLAVSVSIVPQAPEESLWKKILDHISWKISLAVAVGISIVIVVPVVIVLKKDKPPLQEIPPPPPETKKEPVQVELVPARRVQLTVMSGAIRHRTDNIAIAGKTVVGRDKACDVSYPEDAEMSSKHFELIVAGEHVEIKDLDSTNGTLLNGSRLVSQHRLEDGDWIRAGRTEIRVTFGA
jgi:VWFA-related protein